MLPRAPKCSQARLAFFAEHVCQCRGRVSSGNSHELRIYIYISKLNKHIYISKLNKHDSKNRLFYHFHPSANDFSGNIWHMHKYVAHQRNIYWWSHHIQGWEFPSVGFATGRDMYMPLPNQFAILPDLFIISHALPFCQSPVNSS